MAQELELAGGGRIRQWEDGGRVHFRCEIPTRRDGLYKVWLRGDGGEMLLGTPTPEGESMCLCRTVSREELRRCGCWPVRSARCVMAYPFRQQRQPDDGWYWEQDPARFVDRETRELGVWRRMLCRKGEGYVELACCAVGAVPMPLVHLFCLADVRQLRGEKYMVWRFSSDGTPSFPEKIEC